MSTFPLHQRQKKKGSTKKPFHEYGIPHTNCANSLFHSTSKKKGSKFHTMANLPTSTIFFSSSFFHLTFGCALKWSDSFGSKFFAIFYIKFFEDKLGKKNVFSKENFATFSEKKKIEKN